jgi:hypothetical protein
MKEAGSSLPPSLLSLSFFFLRELRSYFNQKKPVARKRLKTGIEGMIVGTRLLRK